MMRDNRLPASKSMEDYYCARQNQDSTDVDRALNEIKEQVKALLGPEAVTELEKWLEIWLDVLNSNPDTNMNTWRYKENYWEAVEMTLYEKLTTRYTARLDSRVELRAGEPSLLNNLRKSIFLREYQFLQGYGNCCVHMLMMGRISAEHWEGYKSGRFEEVDKLIDAVDSIMRE